MAVCARLYDTIEAERHYICSGDERARDPKLLGSIRYLGCSSIVEGSDAEVPVHWLDLASEEFMEEGGALKAAAAWDSIVDMVNDAACELWEEADSEEEE